VSTAAEAATPGAGAAGEGRPSPFALLFAPDRGMERQARAGRARGVLLFAWAAALLLGASMALRVDAAQSTLRKMEMSGQLQGMSDRQLADETHNAERLFAVVSVAKAVVGTPVALGLGCVAILWLTWFFRGRVKGSAVVPVAAATLLPAALADLLDAVTVFRLPALPPEGVPLTPRALSAVLALAGRPLMDPWLKIGNALDFFSLWGAILMGFGVAAAGGVPKRTAVIGTLIAWVCYRLLTQVAVGG
jgi:hypothetical protein